MTDEGSAFPLVCETMDWVHILDRKHFTDQISTKLANLSDPDAFRLSITEILDSPSISVYTTLMKSANNVYRTHQAKAFLKKIELNKKRLVYCYTSKYFTAAQVSTQRSEGGMSVIKGNGTVKKYLRNATYIESLDRISQTARKQDRDARDELKRCRQNGFMVGERFRQNLDKAIIDSMLLSYVSPSSSDSSKHIVKVNKNSEIFCEVNLKGNTVWQGFQYTTITGTCPYYKSTLLICPCACAAAQRREINIKDPMHAHPRYLIGHHPLWPIAISDLTLSDYEDAPWSRHMRVAPAVF